MADSKLTPAYDNKIYQKYSKKTIANKEKNKVAFCQDYGLTYDKKVPIVCLTFPLTDKNNVEMIQDIMNGLLEQPLEIVLTGVGTEKFQKVFTELVEKNPNKITVVDGDEETKRKIYAASDIVLVSSDTEECIEEAKNAMAYGCIPILPPVDFAEDYDPIAEKGSAFVYKKDSPWSLFANVVRAMENFRFPYDWKNIAVSSME